MTHLSPHEPLWTSVESDQEIENNSHMLYMLYNAKNKPLETPQMIFGSSLTQIVQPQTGCGTCKTVKARFWPWGSRSKALKRFELFHLAQKRIH